MIRDITFFRSVFTLKDLPDMGLPEICLSGRSNVGKSSLINRLANRRDLAKTSQKPGKTRSLNFYLVQGRYFLVDLPGYGYARVPKTEKSLFGQLVNPYLEKRSELLGVIQLIDSRHGPLAGDALMLEWIRNWNMRALYVFTKADKLSANDRTTLHKTYEKEFGMENIVMFSASSGTGLKTVESWIEATVRSAEGD
ncbi:MAG: ribosome biogenesis GTP-binding protein YihA/YsxC [Candidatus Latescibacterota bacterium]